MPIVTPPPGPKGHWLLGHLPERRRDVLGFFSRCAREYGDVVALRVAWRRAYLVNHPDGVEPPFAGAPAAARARLAISCAVGDGGAHDRCWPGVRRTLTSRLTTALRSVNEALWAAEDEVRQCE
jgi:hypothetical protein